MVRILESTICDLEKKYQDKWASENVSRTSEPQWNKLHTNVPLWLIN